VSLKRIVVVICVILVAIRVGSQSSGTAPEPPATVAACVAAVQASLQQADASATAAWTTYQDTVQTFNDAPANTPAQQDAANVMNSTSVAATSAQTADNNVQSDLTAVQNDAASNCLRAPKAMLRTPQINNK